MPIVHAPLTVLLTFLLTSTLGACAGVSDLQVVDAGSNPGGYRADGTYLMSGNEHRMSCGRLASEQESFIKSMKAQIALAKSEQETVAPSTSRVLQRAFGSPGSGLAALDAFDRQSAKADAYAAEMLAKKCPDSSAVALVAVRAEAAAIRAKR